MQRESMEFDVVIVGAGPAGLSAACRIMQLAQEREQEITVCVVEKGSEVGAHILSGAVFEPRALAELFPDWKSMEAPLGTEVTEDRFLFYTSEKSAVRLPGMFLPKPIHNHGNYVVSMGNVCRWLAEQAESLGVEVYPGFAASEVLFADDGSVRGIATGDMGIAADGSQKDSYMPGMELHARYTLFAEGCRGHLGKQLIQHFDLSDGRDPAALRHRHQGDLGDSPGEALPGTGGTRPRLAPSGEQIFRRRLSLPRGKQSGVPRPDHRPQLQRIRMSRPSRSSSAGSTTRRPCASI